MKREYLQLPCPRTIAAKERSKIPSLASISNNHCLFTTTKWGETLGTDTQDLAYSFLHQWTVSVCCHNKNSFQSGNCIHFSVWCFIESYACVVQVHHCKPMAVSKFKVHNNKESKYFKSLAHCFIGWLIRHWLVLKDWEDCICHVLRHLHIHLTITGVLQGAGGASLRTTATTTIRTTLSITFSYLSNNNHSKIPTPISLAWHVVLTIHVQHWHKETMGSLSNNYI